MKYYPVLWGLQINHYQNPYATRILKNDAWKMKCPFKMVTLLRQHSFIFGGRSGDGIISLGVWDAVRYILCLRALFRSWN